MATKKISELPLITALSGSQEETLIPVVVGGLNGTTNRITAENFSKFVNAYNATTSSNTFIGAQIINGNLTITGNQVISGRLTVYEVVAQYETASILFSTGSTKLGDQLTDTHEFTGSTNITGSIIVDGNLLLNGASLNNSFVRIHQATGSLQNFTSSQADRNLDLSIVTGSLNQFTASQDDRNFVISQFTASQLIVNTGLASVTASLNNFSGSTNAFTGAIEQTTASIHLATASLNYFYSFSSSQLVVNTGLASVTASLNNFSGSTNAFTGGIEKTTASIHLATASLNYFYQSTSSLNGFTSSQADRNLNLSIVTGSLNRFTASQDDRNFVISQFTSSTNAHIVGISDFTSSQLAVNLGNSIYTASVDSHIVGISTYTSSVRDTLARVHQATRSLELHSGSMVGVTNGLMAYTASNTTLNAGLRDEVNGIEAYTASLKGQAIVSSSTQVQNYDVFALNSNLYTSTGSLIGITNGLMAFTAALDSTYATDAQLYQLYQATRSIELTTGSLIGITNGLMAFTAALDSTYATDAQLYQLYAETASIKAEIGGIELYTASLKAASIVSSSTQVQNYDVFALNSNLYNGTGSIKGEIAGIEAYTASLKGAIEVSGQNVNVLGMITAQQFNVTYVSSSVMYQSGSTKLGNSSDDKHEITGSLNTSFGGRGGLFINDGFQKTFTFPTGNLFSIDFGSAEGGGFVDVTYGGVVTSIGGRGGATRYAIAYKNATDAVATKVHGYGDDIVSASISATKVAIFSIGGDAVQSSKYQVNVSVNAVAADGAGDYEVIQYKKL